MNFTDELSEMIREHYNKTHPEAMKTGYFDHVFKVEKPKSASQFEKLIIKFLELKGHQAQKITTTGIYRDNTKKHVDAIGRVRITGSGKWTPGTATKGQADITSSIYSIKVDWEVKFSKSDRQSDAQKRFEAEVERAGGYYFVIRTLDDFYEKYYKLIEQPKFVLMKSL